MVQALEEQATTDGSPAWSTTAPPGTLLRMLGRAERHSMHVSFLLTDIDHFKKNQRYPGHPTGDQS